jgi:hypothetical protein
LTIFNLTLFIRIIFNLNLYPFPVIYTIPLFSLGRLKLSSSLKNM